MPALELIESVEELRKALKDPAELLQKLDEGVGPEAKRFVIAKVRPKLAEMLREHPGVQWEEASLRISKSTYFVASGWKADSRWPDPPTCTAKVVNVFVCVLPSIFSEQSFCFWKFKCLICSEFM